MRAAVVGAGVFGATAAIELARSGVPVDLYDRHPDIMCGASRANQGRLHMGYHYPRSPDTAAACAEGSTEFARRYPSAVDRSNRHHYVIAYYGRSDRHSFLDFCAQQALPYQAHRSPLVQPGPADLCVTVPEAFVKLRELRRLLKAEIRSAGVRTRFGAAVDPYRLPHDLVVDATYGQAGSRVLRFEICEIALIRLGPQFAGQSFVILDGDFVSLDPLGELHMLYDVKHSVHHANEGTRPEIPDEYRAVLDLGPVPTPLSRVDQMQLTARRYLRGIGLPEYRGSMFTVRAVLPGVDSTDERPTVVGWDGKVVSVLGGKLDTALSAARRVVQTMVPA